MKSKMIAKSLFTFLCFLCLRTFSQSDTSVRTLLYPTKVNDTLISLQLQVTASKPLIRYDWKTVAIFCDFPFANVAMLLYQYDTTQNTFIDFNSYADITLTSVDKVILKPGELYEEDLRILPKNLKKGFYKVLVKFYFSPPDSPKTRLFSQSNPFYFKVGNDKN